MGQKNLRFGDPLIIPGLLLLAIRRVPISIKLATAGIIGKQLMDRPRTLVSLQARRFQERVGAWTQERFGEPCCSRKPPASVRHKDTSGLRVRDQGNHIRAWGLKGRCQRFWRTQETQRSIRHKRCANHDPDQWCCNNRREGIPSSDQCCTSGADRPEH